MTERGTTIRLATRGSDLALRQAGTVRERLEQRRLTVDLVEVETTGDQLRDELIHRLGTTGAFVRALDEKVLDGDVDAAVHSMKDMPTDQPDDLVVAGIPERAAPNDVLVTPDGTELADLPDGATVGTSSLRRRAQLLAERPDLDVQPLRGNVDTRVEKLLAPSLTREYTARLDAEEAEESDDEDDDGEDAETEQYDRTVEEWFDDLAEIERRALEREVETEYDAICLAEAGLERSGLLHHLQVEHLDPAQFVSAPGQGAIAVTALAGDTAETMQGILDHPRTRVSTTVERTILAELGGGCVAPVGIYARLQGEVVTTTVRVLGENGSEEVGATRDLPVERHREAAREFAADLADQGAATLIEQARRDDPDEAKREQ
ncbi:MULTISPECIES: hydroxymethylbilane synthase [Salinibaculum]|uniref:hydroxymethylbilane synthase n=1 Tax=Salinibaculum TaxID=2732368 RepID=UPI0030CF7DC2